MAPRGRKPKPKRLHAIEGTYRADRHGNRGVELPPGAPGEPAWAQLLPGSASKDLRDEAKAAWLRIVPDLDRMGLLAHVDRDVLVDYCTTRALLRRCVRKVSKEGELLAVPIVRKNGDEYTQLIRHPSLLTIQECRGELNRLRSELGLGPSSRGRLTVRTPEGSDDDEAEVFGT